MEKDTKKEKIQQDVVENMDAEESGGIAGDLGSDVTASTDELITKDGKQLISQGKSITQIAYHEKLNVIIVGTNEGEIFVLDPTLGEILFEKKYEKGVCFNVGPEKEVIVVENDKVGIRNDYNGIFLLDTILQTPVEDISENILLEMNKSEIEIIYNTLSTLETETDKDFKEVVTTLKDILNSSNNKDEIDTRLSVKKEKWSTIKIHLKLSVLKSTFTFMVSELGKKNLYIPALSIASSLVERINLLTPKEKNDFDSPLEKNQMYSEANRLNTFSNWPHQDYRWALPTLMAQAGFYHNPSNNGDDRALCFTCNVCLVSWEPLDEPWSEHERHSPFCSFVRGEHTHNVPLNIPYSTCPAYVVKKSNGKPILGQSSLNNSSVIAYSGGNVVLFDTSKHPKETISFEVTLKDLVFSDSLANITYCDIDLKPKGSFLMNVSESESTGPLNILSQAQDLIKVNPLKHVDITAVAVLGENADQNNGVKAPLVLIGGLINTLNNINSAFLILYSVKTDVLKQEPSKVKPKSANEAKSSGKGTKSENQHFEEDLLSYLSDTDFLTEESLFLDELNKSSNEFLHSMKEKNAGIIKDLKDLKRKLTDDPSQLFNIKAKHNKPKVVIIEKLKIPESIFKSSTSTSYNTIVRHIIPSMDNSEVVIIIDCDKNDEMACDDDIVGAILIYKTKILTAKTSSLTLEKEPHIYKSFKKESQSNNSIKSCCLITPENGIDILLACCFNNGIIQIFNLKGLSLIHSISPTCIDSTNDYIDKFTSVSYCAGLEKLCVGTSKGFLEMYSIKQDSGNDLLKLTNTSSPILKSSSRSSTTTGDLLVYQPLSYKTMKKLHSLTSMINISPSFTASVPSCWLKIIQAQKDRKHPLHLHENECSETLSWRLQANNHTRLEHLFELTLPKSTFVGYIDFKFVLQMGCLNLPKIEVSLYRSTISNNKKSSKDISNDVDSFINFGSQLRSKTPSNEFLKSINAELIMGPLLLENHLDLSASGGQVLLTSPLILLTKGKSFYLHIKAKIDKRDETVANNLQNISSSNKSSSKVKVDSSLKSKMQQQHPSQYPNPNLKSKLYKDDLFEIVNYSSYEYFNPSLDLLQEDPEKKVGCDVLHEISISIKIPKPNSEIPNEHLERRKMLISKEFHEKLVKTVIFKGDEVSYEAQNAALDLLIWISSIILCGPNDSGCQINFIGMIEKYLNEIVLYGILSSDRQTSHKTTGLLISCIDTIETNYSKSESFITSVLKVLINLLKYSLASYSPGCLSYFFLLFNRVRTENLNMANESLLSLLKVTTKELNKRSDDNIAILRTRFGLYGSSPFESDLFEIELPKITKSSSHPLTYAGICSTSDPSLPVPSSVTTNTFRLWGLKDVDFRDLLVGNPLSIRLGKLGGLSPKQQISGLLEVEPLHFSCHASSDGTRIEKIEFAQSTFTSVPIPQPWEPFTNIIAQGEGSKKTEPNKMDQIMMLQKALKMDNNESYYDISDLKFMEGEGYSSIGPIPMSSMYTLENPNWPKSGLVSSGMGSVHMQMTAPNNAVTFEPGKVGFSFTQAQQQQQQKQNSSTPKKVPQQKMAYTSVSDACTTTTDSISVSKTNQSTTPSDIKTVNNGSGIDANKSIEKEDLRLLLSPWQQLQQPPQQLLVIDRMHSGGRRWAVLDFGAPVILTDIVIPFCNDLVSLSIDIWLHREDSDGQRLVICSDIGMRSLVLSDLQPQPICRFLKITVIGRYGMNTTKCRIPIGLFYGHTTILQNIHNLPYSDATILTQQNSIQAQCSVLSYLIEDIECRYQLACAKLKTSLAAHNLYYMPRGVGGRNKLGQCTPSDQSIISTYQECMTLQQQLNVAKNIVKRLQRSLCSTPEYINIDDNPLEMISEICTDKIRSISEYLLDSLLGISYLATNNSIVQSINFDVTALFSSLNQETCETLFREICILENGQTQLSLITLLLRISCYQKWWGNFISSTLKNLFSSFNTQVFPQDRVFLLLVYLGQKALLNGKNTSVLESSMELLNDILLVESDNEFLRASIDMNLVSWVVLFLCLCLDGVNCTLGMNSQDGHIINGNKKSKRSLEGKKDFCSRWNFIQGESVGKLSGPSKIVSQSGFKRRIQKKILAHKQKLEELDNVASGLGYSSNPLSQHFGGLSQLSALGSKIEAIKAKQYFGKTIKLQSSKQFKDLLHIRRGDLYGKRDFSIKEEEKEILNEEINLNLDPKLCLKVAKSLGKLLLKMDSTCQSDIFLHCISILSRISTSCRPAISLGSIFDSEEIYSLLFIAIGSDNNSSLKNNWSSPWVSHSIMCLFLDILEAEKIFPQKTEREMSPTTALTTDMITSIETESQLNNNNNSMSNDSHLDTSEEMIIDDAVDSITVNEMLKYGSNSTTPIEAISINESDESDIEEVISESSNSAGLFTRFKKTPLLLKLSPCMTSISTALDARLENSIESTTELRLRMMTIIDSEVLSQSLKAPIELPVEILKNIGMENKDSSNQMQIDESMSGPSSPLINSNDLLSISFNRIFQTMSDSSAVSIEKVLHLWLSFNFEASGIVDASCMIEARDFNFTPTISISSESVSSLMMVFTKNRTIGIQEWGLLFQCLTLAANQTTNSSGIWFHIINDKNFSEMILKFISGGINLQKNQMPSVGPTICKHFYTFLVRLRQLANNDSPKEIMTVCLKEILLRILDDFLSGPFLNADFPLDGLIKFLDSLDFPDLSFDPLTLVSIFEKFAQILHIYVFFPNKLSLKTTDIKPLTNNQPTGNEAKSFVKTQTFENIMFRLVKFASSIVTLPYKSKNAADKRVQEFFNRSQFVRKDIQEMENNLSQYLASCGPNQPRTIADIIFQSENSMMRVLSVLANPNGMNVLTSGDLLNSNSLNTDNPTTFVESVNFLFTKLCNNASNSKWTFLPILKFLNGDCPLSVSETFVLMVLKVINNEEYLKEFTKLNCIESICYKFVLCCRKQLCSSPSYISYLTQFIGKSDSNLMGQKRLAGSESLESDGLINVAPLGTISSTNLSAHPSDVLLATSAPHRRARSPAWSYHFNFQESFLELVINLPCAILLKEIQIIPHLTSISTSCPSAVQVEISKDRCMISNPIGPAINCSSVSSINIQLKQPEVAQTIVIRLFKPKDSHTIGLSQIRILGCTTFSEASLQGFANQDNLKYLETSTHWMYIMDRAFSVSKDNHILHNEILEKSIIIPNLLESCYSLLLSPNYNEKNQEIFLPRVTRCLYEFASFKKSISDSVLMALLGPVQLGFSRANANQIVYKYQLNASVELVYQLCTSLPLWGHQNLNNLIKWLESVADMAINDNDERGLASKKIVPDYIHAISCILWNITDVGKSDLSSVVNANLLKKLLQWTRKLDCKSELRACIDHVLCSICFNKPWLFIQLMYEMDIIKPFDDQVEEKGQSIEELLQNWYDEGQIWNRMHVKNLDEIELSEGCLMTIGRAAKSLVVTKILHESEFLIHLNSSIMDYWSYYFKKWIKLTSASSESDQDQDQNEEEMPMSPKKIISTQNLIGILSLYSELCNINEFKNWFGNQGSVFWSPILTLLSTISSNFKRLYFGHSIINLESAFISFFSSCCWTHQENQKIISTLLCEILLKQKSTQHKAVFLLHSMSSFCRRLLIQLLLENEKVTIHIKNHTKYPLKIPVKSIPLKNKHPALLINGGDRIFQMNINSTFYELLKFIEPTGVTFEQNIKNNNSLTTSDTFSVLKNQQGLIEQGLELIEQIQSNLAVKEKRIACTTMPPQQQQSISITTNLSPFSTTTITTPQEAAAGGSSSSNIVTIKTINPDEIKRPYKMASKKLKPDTVITENNTTTKVEKEKEGPILIIESEDYQNTRIPLNLIIAQIYSATRKPNAFLDMLVFNFREDTQQQQRQRQAQGSISTSSSSSTSRSNSGTSLDIERNTLEKKLKELYPEVFNVLPIPATIEVFSKIGGLGLLAKHLPIVYPETLRQFSVPKYIANASTLMQGGQDKESPTTENDWVKIENSDDFYEEMMDSIVASSTPIPKRNVACSTSGSNLPPQYSMYAFGLFLTLPRFSEVLLTERLGAQCMLRLCLGVTDDADGNDIFGSAVASKLPTLPFYVLRSLLDSLDLNSDEGKQIRQAMIDTYSLHFILACLSIFSHQNCDSSLVPNQHELVIAATKIQGGYNEKGTGKSDDKSHVYWAKGTGFGTGSTQQSWDVELALQKKKNEEENVTCLLLVLSSYIFPKILSRQFFEEQQQSQQQSTLDQERLLPEEIINLIKKSCLFPAISGYLRNDSVLDMARHVPLYKAVLLFLRSLVSSPQLLPLLAPWEKTSSPDDRPISILLSKMRDVVENYTRRLSNNKGKLKAKQTTAVKTGEEIDDEGLALLINDIKSTAHHVEIAIDDLTKRFGPSDIEMKDEIMLSEARKTIDERYIEEMKAIQFGFYEMIVEEEAANGIRFTVPYHYESNVRSNWSRTFSNRLKRLAQESVTLSSSLPIAYGSTIFIRCDNDRLDVMKVLITGPSCTPYSNGCFEFDVFFPNDYPNSPMLINLETTGRQRVRFNPNLYTDGKVCLSILNTWHGRPEEKWNPQTSSLLPVLVAIQSLILNTEPYFNEPGYEKSRGTEQGERNSREYNAGIQIATLEWAMLDQLKNPSLCFKDIIQRHFWMKRAEIIDQLEKWLTDLIVTCKNDKRAGKNVSADPVGVFKNNFNLLKKEFLNMKPPAGLEDLQVSDLIKNEGENVGESLSSSSSSSVAAVKVDQLDTSTTSELTNNDKEDSNSNSSNISANAATTGSILSTTVPPAKNQIEQQFEQAGINLEQVIIDTLDMNNSGETASSTASENDQMDQMDI